MDGESGYRASGEAGNGLDQRGGEARMVFVHKARRVVDVIMAWCRGQKVTTIDVGGWKISRELWRGQPSPVGRLC
jgi:hypothetical protein